MKFYLIVAKGSKRGMPIPISVDLFLIGSDRVCQLRKDKLGDKQCALVTRDKKVFIQDLDSGHLTIVNGAAIQPGIEWPLHAGDHIEVGPLEFIIQYAEKPLSQRDLEEWAAGCLDKDSNKGIGEDEDAMHQPTDASSAAQGIIDALQKMKGVVEGRLRIGVEAGVHVVRVHDNGIVAEAEIALIKKEMTDKFDKPNMRILLDLKNVKRMSTAGVLMLVELNRFFKYKSSHFALCRVRSEMEDVMGTLKMDNIPIFNKKDDALAAKW